MINNFIKIALRNIRGGFYHFLLNLLGLILGISCFVVLQVYTHHEQNYESFMDRPDDIYRATTFIKRGENEMRWAITNGGLVDILRNDVAQVEDAMKIMTVQRNMTFKVEDQLFNIPERNGFHCDSNFFNVMNFNLVKGNKETALNGANKIVLSADFAKKLFPQTDDILGKELDMVDSEENTTLTVTGVVDVPTNTHLQFNFLLSGPTMGSENWTRLANTQNSGYGVRVYFKTTPQANEASIAESFAESYKLVYGENFHFPIQPITDIHFNATNLFEDAKVGNKSFVLILSIISWMILVIACINYVLLSTSKLMRRSREIGIRKTLGSSVGSLLGQFLTESAVIGLMAGILSLVVIEFLFKAVFQQSFSASFSIFNDYRTVPLILLFSIVIGVISGLFPAIQSTKTQAIRVLRQNANTGGRQSIFSFRTILVIIQFAFTISIISGSILVFEQLDFLRNKDLGYDKDQVITIRRNNSIGQSEWDFFLQSLKDESSINKSGQILYDFLSDYNAHGIRIPREGDTTTLRVQWNSADADALEALGLRFVEGRNFSDEIASDSSAIIVNEAARRALGIDTLANQTFLSGWIGQGKIIGVVEDFHFQSFDKEVIPIMFMQTSWKRSVVVNVNESNFSEALNAMNRNWKTAGIESPFEYTFMDQSFAKLIEKETRLSDLIKLFAAISITIALLGILGLISHSTSLRLKEIGVRKVFGASTTSILLLINQSVAVVIGMSFIIAVPLTIWAGKSWLGNFAYKTSITGFELAAGLLITLIITVVAISIQSFKAARSNPARTLKSE